MCSIIYRELCRNATYNVLSNLFALLLKSNGACTCLCNCALTLKHFTFLPKEFMHVFLLIVIIGSDISSNSFNRSFDMDTECVLCDKGTESL